MYSNPKNIWQDRVAVASPPHHEEGGSMQIVLRPCLLYSASPCTVGWAASYRNHTLQTKYILNSLQEALEQLWINREDFLVQSIIKVIQLCAS